MAHGSEGGKEDSDAQIAIDDNLEQQQDKLKQQKLEEEAKKKEKEEQKNTIQPLNYISVLDKKYEYEIKNIQEIDNYEERNEAILNIVEEISKNKLPKKYNKEGYTEYLEEGRVSIIEITNNEGKVSFECAKENTSSKSISIPHLNKDGTKSRIDFDVIQLDEKGNMTAFTSSSLIIDNGEIKERENSKTTSQLDKAWLKKLAQGLDTGHSHAVVFSGERENIQTQVTTSKKVDDLRSKDQPSTATTIDTRERSTNNEEMQTKDLGKKEAFEDQGKRSLKSDVIPSTADHPLHHKAPKQEFNMFGTQTNKTSMSQKMRESLEKSSANNHSHDNASLPVQKSKDGKGVQR